VPEIPKSLLYVWHWFIKLHSTRSAGMGLNPINFQEIYSFCKLYGIIMSEWEIDLIRQLDSTALIELQKDK
jgi:hypothetical protein